MTQTSTLNDLIRYIFKETSEEENEIIANNLLCNSELLNDYAELASIIANMESIEESPSQRTVENILKYSKELNKHSVKA